MYYQSTFFCSGSSHRVTEVRRESFSYPGLDSIYERHTLDAIVPILAFGRFYD